MSNEAETASQGSSLGRSEDLPTNSPDDISMGSMYSDQVGSNKQEIKFEDTYMKDCGLHVVDWTDLIKQQHPDFTQLPHITKEEFAKGEQLTSLLWNEYSVLNMEIHPERELFYKLFRYREAKLEYIERMMSEVSPEMKRKWRVLMFQTLVSIGHLTLLASDYGKALSAYQNALRTDKERFARDPTAHYGLALVYFHFKKFKAAVECFNLVLYTHKDVAVVPEIHARLGACYKHLDKFDLALKHYQASLADSRDAVFHSKLQLRICIASCYQCSEQLDKAYEEYKQLATELDVPPEQQTLETQRDRATVLRELGWVCYLHEEQTQEARTQRLLEAEEYLNQSKAIEPNSGKTYYYLGRCYGEIKTKAHEAFINYRQAIDKTEGDADTWCSIGLLYQDQNQPMDALQAFICAVELDPQHSPAWTNLGQLYLSTHQYSDALECYKQAIKFSPCAPNPLKQIIQVLEKELTASTVPPTPGKTATTKLPCLKEAWQQPIPSELRQRQTDFSLQKQYRYREGSAVWTMTELEPRILKRPYKDINGQQRQMNHQQAAVYELLNRNKDDLAAVPEASTLHGELIKMKRPSDERNSISPMTAEELARQKGDHASVIHDMKLPGNASYENMKRELHQQVDSLPMFDLPSSSTVGILPKNFSLIAPLRVPLDIGADEIYSICDKRTENSQNFKPIFEEEVLPPDTHNMPQVPSDIKVEPSDSSGIRPTPLIVVDNRNEAQLVPLQTYLQGPSCSIAVVRGLTHQLRMDLSLYSTKSLLELIPDQSIEVRTQYKLTTDQNVNAAGQPTWEFYSQPGFSKVIDYATYQAQTFKYCLKEEAEKLRAAGAKYGQNSDQPSAKKKRSEDLPVKTIKFGTNIDISDSSVFGKQLRELQKLPPFCRPGAASDMLSHLGYTILGMNTVQMYMKVPHARTPAHVENNCFASVNINIGPGDCEWFAVPYDHWSRMNQMCEERKVDFLSGSWWPDIDELIREGIPVYRFTQKAGDLVWVGPGCIHWVQATGWCNNIAWNVGPVTQYQIDVALRSYEWNKKANFKSLVPMQLLCWQIAKNVKFTHPSVYSTVKAVLIRSLAYCKMVAKYAESVGKVIKYQTRQTGEAPPYCKLCDVEVFNVLFVKMDKEVYNVYCVTCAQKCRFQEDKQFLVLQQFPFSELSKIFEQCQVHYVKKAQLVA